MAYPLHGESGKVTSVTSSTDLNQLLMTALRNTQIVLTVQTDMQNVSGDGGTTTKNVAGLRNTSYAFTGLYPKAAPKIGLSGLVTFSSGTVYRVSDWSMNIDFGEHEITEIQGAATIQDRQYRPSIRPQISGTYTSLASSAAALTLPASSSTASAAATFKLCEDDVTKDPNYSGNILISQLGWTTGGRDTVKASYAWVADDTITAESGTNYLIPYPNLASGANGAVDMPDWGDGTTGPATVANTIELDASRTYALSGTGKWAYLRSLAIRVSAGDVTTVSGVVRISGALTLA